MRFETAESSEALNDGTEASPSGCLARYVNSCLGMIQKLRHSHHSSHSTSPRLKKKAWQVCSKDRVSMQNNGEMLPQSTVWKSFSFLCLCGASDWNC